jgi:hypothetical protein
MSFFARSTDWLLARPQGESYSDVILRLARALFLDELQLDHPGRRVRRPRLLKVGQTDAAGRFAFLRPGLSAPNNTGNVNSWDLSNTP